MAFEKDFITKKALLILVLSMSNLGLLIQHCNIPIPHVLLLLKPLTAFNNTSHPNYNHKQERKTFTISMCVHRGK